MAKAQSAKGVKTNAMRVLDAQHVAESEPMAGLQDRFSLGIANLRLEHDLNNDPGHRPAFPRPCVATQRTRRDAARASPGRV